MVASKFKEGNIYATESTSILNKLRGVRDKLNSMNALGYDTRRDMANLLYLLETSMVDITNIFTIAEGGTIND